MLHKSESKLQSNPFFQILMTLFFGFLIGLISVAFIKVLALLAEQQKTLNADTATHLVLVPLVLFFIQVIKQKTLYFPTKVLQVSEENSSAYWSAWMAPIHFFGTLLSHASGVSVGREGAAVLYSAGLVRAFRMSWNFWGPVVCAIGFSSIIGNFWVAPFFMFELFGSTKNVQKIYALIGAWVSTIVGQFFHVQHLFVAVEVKDNIGFFMKFIFLFIFALSAGFLMRYYKKMYFILSDLFLKTSLFNKVLVSITLALFLYLPNFRIFQSLGLEQFQNLSQFDGSFANSLLKLSFTLISTSVGFLGGEFIPLIYSGTHFGASFFNFFGYSSQLGSVIGAFVLFAAGTRFKWTSYILLLSLAGLEWWYWAYFVVAIAIAFSGSESLYKKEEVEF